jgi:ComF family protein
VDRNTAVVGDVVICCAMLSRMAIRPRTDVLKRHAVAVAQDIVGRALPDAERWTKASLIRCRGPWCLRCGHSAQRHIPITDGCPHCQENQGVLDGVCRVGSYQDGCAGLVLALKFRRWWELSRPLGQRLAWTLRAQCGAERVAQSVVVPVPMPLIRRWKRGIDHAAILAREVAQAADASFYRALWRRGGSGQAGASRSARQRASARGWHLHLRARERLRGRNVILVDDVLTTGRTARIAGGLLRQAGASTITVAVIAVADRT